MTIAEQLLAAAQLMALGMGTVFGFLTLLVFTLYGMSKLANVIDREDDRRPGADSTATLRHPVTPGEDDELVAVISAAIARYRALHRR